MPNDTPAAIGADALREALLVARDHIDMGALRISHCKDAALITAALASAAQPSVPHAQMTEEIDLVLSDPDTRLSPGAERALRWLRTWTDAPLAIAAAPNAAPAGAAAELRRQRELLGKQQRTIEALNSCIGGDGSTTTENLRIVDRLTAEFESLRAQAAPAAVAEPSDDFRGDTPSLVRAITALLDLDAAGALVPHGIGGHARSLLAAAASRLAAPAPAAQESRAWRDYAEHLEWCLTCAEDSVGSCEVGARLKSRAQAKEGASSAS